MFMPSKTAKLRQLFQAKPILRIMGAHNGLGAKLIERNHFDGIWASGLEISTSYALPDANILTMTENLHAATMINDATELPVICDCDTGYGNAFNVQHMVKKYEAAGIAAVVIEDKLFPKVNSFIPGRQELASVEEFMGKIEAAKNAQVDPDFMVFARIEALIAGWGMDEALRRAYAYAEAGADGLVIHSKGATPDEIYEFIQKFKGKLPVIVIPTTFYGVTADELASHGVKMVIYANQGLRASIRAMDETFKKIRETGSTASVEKQITPMKEVFEIQGMHRLKDEEKKYLRKETIQAVIPAAGDPPAASDLGPVLNKGPLCMLPICGKTLIDRQMDTLRSCGISDILVVGGYSASSIRLEQATLFQNPNFHKTGVVHSLFSASQAIRGKFVMTYSDIIFDRMIVERLLLSPYDITLVIDRAYQTLPRREKNLDLVIAENSDEPQTRRLDRQPFLPVRGIGQKLPKQKVNYEFIGMALIREEGWNKIKQLWNQAQKQFQKGSFYEAENIEQADFNDLIQYMIDQGESVYGMEIEHGWSEIHSMEDYERVNRFFRERVDSLSDT